MPAVPFLGLIAVETGVAAAIGTAVAGVVGATVGTVAATAIGSGVISAGLTVAQGGSASDALKGAVIGGIASYVGASVSSSVTSSIADAAAQSGASSISASLGKVAASMAGGAASSATTAALTGKDPIQALIKGGLTAGLTAGVMEGVRGVTSEIPGFDDLSEKYGTAGAAAERAINAGLAAGVMGKDVEAAMTQSVLGSLTKSIGSYASAGIKDLSASLKSAYDDAINAGSAIENNGRQQEQLVSEYQSVAGSINGQRSALQANLDKYNENKDWYNNYDAKMRQQGYVLLGADEWGGGGSWARQTGTRTVYYGEGEYGTVPTYSYDAPSRDSFLQEANKYAKLVNDATPAYNAARAEAEAKLGTLSGKLDSLKAELPTLEKAFTEKKTALDENVVAFQKQEETNADILTKAFDSAVTAKTRLEDVLGEDLSQEQLDAIVKTGDPLSAVDAFTKSLDGADEETKKLAFDKLGDGVDTAVAFAVDHRETTADEARDIMLSLGYENPTDDEVAQFAGLTSESAASRAAQAYVDQHSVSEDEARKYLTDLGYTPTDDEVKQFAKQGADVMQSDVESQLGDYAGSHTIDRAEAEKFFADLGYTPSEEDLQQFMRQGADVSAESVAGDLNQYVDENQITEDEARDIYAQMGLKNPTQEDIEKLMGQYAEADLESRAQDNLDAARYNSLYEMIQNADTGATDDLEGQITDIQSNLEEQIAGQGEQFQTLLQQYEDLGMSRDEALQQAMTDMQGTLGEQIAGQGEQFQTLLQQYEDLGMSRDEALQQAMTDMQGTLGEQIAGQSEQFQTLLQQYEDLGLSRDEALQQAMTDMQGTLGEQIAANQDATQAGFAELENKFKAMYDESNTDTQAKFDELTDSQKALAASLAATTGDLQAAIDEAAQNTTDMFANLQDTFGGQLQDFQTTVDQRMQELQDQGMSQQEALNTVNSELDQMREDFGVQLGGTEEKLGQQIQQQGVNFGNLFSNWQKMYQDQAAKDAAAQAARDAAAAKAQQDQAAALQAQLNQQQQQSGYNSLLNTLMMAGMWGSQQGAAQPVQTAPADVKSFKEQGYGDIFGTELGFSEGGAIDDLLNILRG